MTRKRPPQRTHRARTVEPPRRPLPNFWREFRSVLLLYALSAVALAWIFPPQGIWPLTFVCLVPWAVATCRTQRAWLVHWLSFFVGWAFFLVSLRWLEPITGLGYVALGLYLAIYWTLAAWALRTARRHGISPIWSLPVVWVACEYLRATVMTGFPWLFLSHALYQQLPLLQISDITGAYGVSFLAGLINGVVVEAALRRWPPPGSKPARTRQLWAGVTAAVILLVGSVGYGLFRINQVDHANTPAAQGPRVAVVQHDFPLESTPPYGTHPYVVLVSYLSLAAEAAAEQPDLIAFPETTWSASQNLEFIEQQPVIPEVSHQLWVYSRLSHHAISAFARADYPAVNVVISELEEELRKIARLRPEWELPTELPRLPAEGGEPATTLVGAVSIEQFPEATYPKVKRYNSALVYDADGEQRPKRYDKHHLVPFGELVPFRGGRLHWLYRWLNSLSPFSDHGRIEYSLTPGDEFTVFDLETKDGTRRFGVPICFEDTTPYVIRNFVWDGGERRVDFLVNISNDGWFHRPLASPSPAWHQRLIRPFLEWFWQSSELPQHLAICTFRAIENRISIARAVNTGISGFIDPNGRIRSLVERDGKRFGRGVFGYDIQRVYLDDRFSFYGRFGDWFALLCLGLTTILWLGAVFERWVLAAKQRIAAFLAKGGT